MAMTRPPVGVSADLFARLREHFNARQMLELTSAIAWENYRARFDHAFGITAGGFSEGAYCPLPLSGRSVHLAAVPHS
jgi:hypothetical protein